MQDIDFKKLKEIVATFPDLPKWERSMIQISGCRTDENVNSDYLAFFLKEDEEHGLGRLFFDNLLEVLKLSASDFQGEYEVIREFPAKEKKRIDIVIKSKSDNWAIIIENKIYHILENDLQNYWDSVKGVNKENKEGVILSLLKEHVEYHKKFKNITHQELVKKFKENLGQNITNCNPKYLPFVRDFILNIENYYFYYTHRIVMNENLRKYQENFEYIKQLEDSKQAAISFLINIIDTELGLSEVNFRSKNNNSTWKRHYYYEGKKPFLQQFRFWIDVECLLNNHFLFTLEFKDKSFESEYDKLLENEIYIDLKNKLSIKTINAKFFQFVLFDKKGFLNEEDGENFAERFKCIIDIIKQDFFQKLS